MGTPTLFTSTLAETFAEAVFPKAAMAIPHVTAAMAAAAAAPVAAPAPIAAPMTAKGKADAMGERGVQATEVEGAVD